MPAGAQTHRLINSSKPMSFTITTDRATTPRARTLLDIFRHKRNRPNRLPRSPSRASASRNRPVGGGLPMVEQSGHHVDVTAPGVMQPSAIGAGDDCCDRGRSWSSRALWRRAARQVARGAHDGSPIGCDGRAHGVAVTAGGPEFGPPYDGRLLTDDRGLAASRLPDGRNGRSVAATLAAPVHRRSSASPRSYVNGIDARTLRRRRRRPRRPLPSSRTDR